MFTTVSTSPLFKFNSCDLKLVNQLRAELACSDALAWTLARRGVSVTQALELLELNEGDGEDHFHSPLLLGEMAAAVERIKFAIEAKERIVVHGDYDADGICATTLLVESLEALGADAYAFLPDRFTNGYGLKHEQIECFVAEKTQLLIAVDCGITAIEQVKTANSLGLDVIICDHHQPLAELPEAIIASSRPSKYPLPDICATVIAGKLVQALGGEYGSRQHELEAIATVADCMPLVGENRATVKRGLKALRTTKRFGIQALANVSGLKPHEITADDIGFKLAPRINATGRIKHPDIAYELLRSNAENSKSIASTVDEINTERKELTALTVNQAIEQVEGWSLEDRNARIYVVSADGWHKGIIGIVASKLVERYCRPVIVVAEGDPSHGSGRSVDSVNLYAAISSCDDLLIAWGGHKQAAGITVSRDNIQLLRSRLASWAEEHISDQDLAVSDLIDAVVAPSEITMDLVQEIERLSPFGTGWERPKLLALDTVISNPKAVGDGTHLRCDLQWGSKSVSAIGFGQIDALARVSLGEKVDVCFQPSINRFRNSETLQAEILRIYDIPDKAWKLPGAWQYPLTKEIGKLEHKFEDLIEQALSLVDSELEGHTKGDTINYETLLVKENTIDLRGKKLSDSYIAQLLATEAKIGILVADVARRSQFITDLIHPDRFSTKAAIMLDSRMSYARVKNSLSEIQDEQESVITLTDYSSLHLLNHIDLDVLIVYDPPATKFQMNQIIEANHKNIHLIFSDREIRFSSDALAEMLDIRLTLGKLWKDLYQHGQKKVVGVPDTLVLGKEYAPVPAAIIYGVRKLIEQGMLEHVGNGILIAHDPRSKPVPTTIR